MKKNLLLLVVAAALVGCGTVTSSSVASSVPASSVTPVSSVSGGDNASSEAPVVSSEGTTSSEEPSSSVPVTSIEESYAIAKSDAISGGDIELSASSAKAGDTVTVTVTADENKQFDALTSSVSGVEFLPSDTDPSVFTFTMPGEDIVIGASFLNLGQVTFTNGAPYNISSMALEVDGASVDIASDRIVENKEVSITLTCTYSISSSDLAKVYLHINDEIVHPAFENPEDTSGSALHASFTMPGEDVRIVLVLSNSTQSADGYSVTVIDSDDCRIYGYDPQETYSYFSASLIRTPGYRVTSAEYQFAGSDAWNALTVSFSNHIAVISIPQLTGDVTIRISGEMVGMKHITYVNDDLVSSYSAFASDVNPGDTVSIYGISAKNSGQYIASITIDGVENPAVTNSSYSFTMPDNDVTITFNVEDNGSIIVAPSDAVASCVISAYSYSQSPITSAAPNTIFYLFVTMNSGYLLSGARINGGDLIPATSSWSGTYIMCTMPASGDANITIEASQAYTPSCATVDNGTLSFSATSYAEGATVTFTSQPSSAFYHLTDVTTNYTGDAADLNLTFTESGGSFTMPACDIVLTPTFERVTTHQVTVSVDELDEVLNNATITIYGQKSMTRLTKDNLSGEFIDGESAAVSLSGVANGYAVTLVVSDGSGETRYIPTYSSRGTVNFNAFTVSSDATISFETTAMSALNVTVENDVGATLVYTVEGSAVEGLEGNIFAGNTLKVSVSGTPTENHQFVVSVYADDAELTKNSYSEEYTVPSSATSLRIVVTEVEVCSFTLNVASNLYFYCTLNGSSLSSGVTSYVLKDSENSFYYCNYSSSSVTVTITVNGEVFGEFVLGYSYASTTQTITATGDIVVTVALTA